MHPLSIVFPIFGGLSKGFQNLPPPKIIQKIKENLRAISEKSWEKMEE